jgi:hypothetical protein
MMMNSFRFVSFCSRASVVSMLPSRPPRRDAIRKRAASSLLASPIVLLAKKSHRSRVRD